MRGVGNFPAGEYALAILPVAVGFSNMYGLGGNAAARGRVYPNKAWDDGDELRRRAWCFAPKRSDAARAVLRVKLREVQRELDLLHKRESKLVDELTTFHIAPITLPKSAGTGGAGIGELPDL